MGNSKVMGLSVAAVALLVLQVVLYTLLFLEGNYGGGTLVFTIIFSMGCMLVPCLVLYTAIYYCRKTSTAVEYLMVYLPVVVLIAATWFYMMGTLKLFLDQLDKDVFRHIVPEFNTRDHIMTWSLAVLYLLASIQCIRVFRTHLSLIGLDKLDSVKGDQPATNSGIKLLFVCQLVLNVVDFLVGLDVLSSENVCAFCIGCAQRINHQTQCNLEMTQSSCEEAGFAWCETHEGKSFTVSYVVSFGVSSFTLGMVFFLMLMHMFGDSEAVVAIENHHKWSLVPVFVVMVNTWVCGSGVTRIFMSVLGVEAMDEVYPTFSGMQVALMYGLLAVYVLHIPICFYLISVHMNNHRLLTKRIKDANRGRKGSVDSTTTSSTRYRQFP